MRSSLGEDYRRLKMLPMGIFKKESNNTAVEGGHE
jgi:hypothetical protein